jgi:hypothetical protein
MRLLPLLGHAVHARVRVSEDGLEPIAYGSASSADLTFADEGPATARQL